jgi:arylsulfatase A-like enzyme
MKAKKIVTLLSIGVIAGFVWGLFACLDNILANRYIQDRMYRLFALSFPRYLNRYILYFLVGLLVFFAVRLLLVKKMRWDRKRRLRFDIFAVIIFAAFSSIKLLLERFTDYNLLSLLGSFAYRISELLYGRINLRDFLVKIAGRYKIIVISSGIFVILMSIYKMLMRKMILEDLTKKVIKFLDYLPRTAFILLISAAILNLVMFIDSRVNLPSDKPNIVLISIDALRSDRLGCYGYKRNTTPYIDDFAKKAIIFENALTPRPKTTPSMVSVLTGLYPHTHQVRIVWKPLKKKVATLQEILLNKNYTTAAFVGNYVLHEKYSGLGQGFVTYDDRMFEKELNRPIYERKAPAMNKAVFRWLERNYRKRFFLWVHYQDPHGPYIAPKDYTELFTSSDEDLVLANFIPRYQELPWIKVKTGNYIDANLYRDAYDAEIRFCDKYVGELLERLNDLGLANTIIIITADHGESLGEHNYYFEHAQFVYDTCSKVPLLIQMPKITESKIAIKQQVNIMNITPTILDMLGYTAPAAIEGRSLLPLFSGKPFSDNYIFIERRNDIKAVRTDNWKYIENFYCNNKELYNLRTDPGEEKNIFGKNKKVVKELQNILYRWMNSADAIDIKRLKEMQLEAGEKEILKSLGYLQ